MAAHKNVLVPNTLNVVENFWHRLYLLFWKLFQRIHAPGNFTSWVIIVSSVNCSVLTLRNEVICLPVPPIAIIHAIWVIRASVIICLVTQHLSTFWMKRMVLPQLRVFRVLVHRKIQLLLGLSESSRNARTCKLGHGDVFELRFIHSYLIVWTPVLPVRVNITYVNTRVSFWR
jgi:hypothetical protein